MSNVRYLLYVVCINALSKVDLTYLSFVLIRVGKLNGAKFTESRDDEDYPINSIINYSQQYQFWKFNKLTYSGTEQITKTDSAIMSTRACRSSEKS